MPWGQPHHRWGPGSDVGSESTQVATDATWKVYVAGGQKEVLPEPALSLLLGLLVPWCHVSLESVEVRGAQILAVPVVEGTMHVLQGWWAWCAWVRLSGQWVTHRECSVTVSWFISVAVPRPLLLLQTCTGTLLWASPCWPLGDAWLLVPAFAEALPGSRAPGLLENTSHERERKGGTQEGVGVGSYPRLGQSGKGRKGLRGWDPRAG